MLLIGQYGFKDVEPKLCSGDIYDFLATRDGKTFSISVSALTGELTKVGRWREPAPDGGMEGANAPVAPAAPAR